MQPVISDQDAERIADAVAVAEAKSTGEIVTVVVPKSGTYERWRGIGALSLTAGSGFLLAYAFPTLSNAALLLWTLPAFFLAWALCGWDPLLMRLTPPGAEAAAVDARAKVAFFEAGVHRTVDGTGILIFISEAERRVEILADHGIHARVGTDGWHRHVNMMINKFRAGKPADGIVETIAAMGDELAAAFPVQIGDTNEIPDQVQRHP